MRKGFKRGRGGCKYKAFIAKQHAVESSSQKAFLHFALFLLATNMAKNFRQRTDPLLKATKLDGVQRAQLHVLERGQRTKEKEFSTVYNSLVDRFENFGIRSPQNLCSNAFWDEYLKTKRQLREDEVKQQKRARSAAASNVNAIDEKGLLGDVGMRKTNRGKAARFKDDYSSGSESDYNDSDSDESFKGKNKRRMPPSSAPAGGRTQQDDEQKAKPSTAKGRVGYDQIDYDRDAPEFDNKDRSRLRKNCHSVINKKDEGCNMKLHPFIRKLVEKPFAPPKSREDNNTVDIAIQQRKRQASLTKAKIKTDELAKTQPMGKYESELDSKARRKSKGSTSKPSKKTQEVNPIFLDEMTGRDVYRNLIQLEIKLTRQAVIDYSIRNKLCSKREYSMFGLLK